MRLRTPAVVGPPGAAVALRLPGARRDMVMRSAVEAGPRPLGPAVSNR